MSGGGIDRRLGGWGRGRAGSGEKSVDGSEWSSGDTMNVTGQWIGHRPVEKGGDPGNSSVEVHWED